MNLKELKLKVDTIISDLKDNGKFPKENNLIDFKRELNISKEDSNVEIFLMNFGKDIISFSNANGGIILIGIEENKSSDHNYNDIGLNKDNLDILEKVDLNDISQKFEKITKVGVSIDLQSFQISTRKFYYLIIEKNNNILVPIKDFKKYKIYKGEIFYRASSKNEHANKSTADFNRFIQIKANEKSKEFMDIWSKLLPKMVDINPREVLIINPMQNKIYGFNSRDNILSASDIEIDKTKNGVFNVILNAITAGEIGKITTDEGKPLYKIIGEIQSNGDRMFLKSLHKEVEKKVKYKITSLQLKSVILYLKWVNSSTFKVINPSNETINSKFKQFIWIETIDDISRRSRVFFSSSAIPKLVETINQTELHEDIFSKSLELRNRN
ncbi:MAG: ATP-binding protein [Bacteroidetes bacterium 4572_128]|nr:MAG: ATP-binding protein [Bacteroidetes bacterium 4572_128]